MATKKPKKSESKEPKLKVSDDDAFLKLMRQRLDRSVTNEADERKKGMADIKFINGEHWDESTKQQRGKGRLCLTINKLPVFLDQVDGDIRQNTPGIEVKAVDNGADAKTADVIEGLCRYTTRSGAKKIYSYAGIHMAAGGRGAWRLKTVWCDDNSFNQKIELERIINAYSVYFDPAAVKDNKQDGYYFFIVSDMSRDEYKEKYGYDPVDFNIDGTEFANWQTESTVRVAEYFYKEKVGTKTLYLTTDGRTVDDETKTDKDIIERERKADQYKIKWALVDGKRILDREDVPGDMFPVVIVWGKQLCVNGKIESRGIARHAKDSCKLYNYFRSNDAEAAALQPKQPFLMPDKCLGAHKDVWDKSLDVNYPYLPYHVDEALPNLKPTREQPAQSSSANLMQIEISNSEMNDTIGITKAGLGQESNETSGVAIQRRKIESDTGQYAFLDNLAEGVITTGQILIGMIPYVYDTERQIRILGKDMKEKVVTINDGKGIDVTVGKYDVYVSAGGSYSTQREEFLEKIGAILPSMQPEQIAAIGDILFGMMDFPRADDIAARLKRMVPPAILGDEQEMDENGDPIEKKPVEQPPPDPRLIAELELKRIELKQEEVKLEGMKLDNEAKVKLKKEDIAAILAEMMANKEGGTANA
jgi:hypothetical protein